MWFNCLLSSLSCYLVSIKSIGPEESLPVGCYYPTGSSHCDSVQACWSNLVKPSGSHPPSFPRYKKTPLHAVGFFVYGALGWIRTTDRPVRSRVLYPAELRVLYCVPSEVAYYRGVGRLCQQSLSAFRGFFYRLF